MNCKQIHILGIDIGSTTVKIAILDSENEVLFQTTTSFVNIQKHYPTVLTHFTNSVQFRFLLSLYGGLTRKHLEFLCTGGHCINSSARLCTADWCGDWARRWGCKSSILKVECRTAYERSLCRAQVLYWPNGFLQTDVPSGLNEYAKNYKALYSSRPSLCICQIRWPAFITKERPKKIFTLLFSGCRKPDNQRTCMWKPIRGHVAFLGDHFIRTTRNLYPYFKIRWRTHYRLHHSHLFAAIGSA